MSDLEDIEDSSPVVLTTFKSAQEANGRQGGQVTMYIPDVLLVEIDALAKVQRSSRSAVAVSLMRRGLGLGR